MTVIMSLIGVLVFLISCGTAGFKTAWTRLVRFVITGVVIDAILFAIGAGVMYAIAH